MKKYILLLLLATFGMQAQTYQNPTYGKLKLKTNTESTTAEKVNVQETDGTINTISKSDLVNVVDVNDVHSLPLVGKVGKIYVVKNLNKIYRWNGTFYQELAGSDLNYQSIIDALTFTPENVANKATTLTASSTLYPNNDAVIAGLALKEDKANKVTSIGLSANDTNYPSELAVKTYADNLVVGMLNDRGTWDASVNAFPTTGGSGVGGAIRKGDMWYVSVAGTLETKLVNVGDSFRALVNAPAQVAANWSILEANIGYVPANDNAVVHLTGAETITGLKTFNPSVSASSAVARGTYFTPKLSATANNDILVGLDINPTFTNGSFTGVKNISARFNGLADVRASSLGSRFSFGDGSLYFGWNDGNYLDIISSGGLRAGNQGFIKLQLFSNTGSLILQNGGTFTDDGVNRLQVAGTVSSGTTALGNTPPTANNQLTRKDYVDNRLNSKEPSFTKNTAFNKNFGSTAGTVAEGNYPPAKDGTGATGTWGINISGNAASATDWGNRSANLLVNGGDLSLGLGIDGNDGVVKFFDTSKWKTFLNLGSNAYTSTPYLPLSGGTLSGAISGTHATFAGTVKAAPGMLSNELVTRGQLDAAENIIGSSDRFYANPLANMINVDSFALGLATYLRIGNMVTAQVEFTITPIASGLVAFDFQLPFARGGNAIGAMGHGTGKLLGYIIPVSVSSSTTHSAKVEMFTPNIHEIKISATIQYDVTL